MSKKLKLESKHGIPIGKYKPYETVGTVIRIEKTMTVIKSLIEADEKIKEDECQFDNNILITFQYKTRDDKRLTYSISEFKRGDVFPSKLGQKAYGTVVTNQWGTSDFILTHVLEDEKPSNLTDITIREQEGIDYPVYAVFKGKKSIALFEDLENAKLFKNILDGQDL